jgi:hypothetical protein
MALRFKALQMVFASPIILAPDGHLATTTSASFPAKQRSPFVLERLTSGGHLVTIDGN